MNASMYTHRKNSVVLSEGGSSLMSLHFMSTLSLQCLYKRMVGTMAILQGLSCWSVQRYVVLIIMPQFLSS